MFERLLKAQIATVSEIDRRNRIVDALSAARQGMSISEMFSTSGGLARWASSPSMLQKFS